ncbi:MAG: exonuclease [Euryarchaeota archaeon]|nr:exonuclease [Euryarchaeota archaeon]
MIRRTFIILPSVGKATERSLWRRGVDGWEGFLSARSIKGFSEGRKRKLDSLVLEAERFLDGGHTQYFSRILPSSEHWRLFSEVGGDSAFLDIETDGLQQRCRVTVVGIHRGGITRTLVLGQDLKAEALSRALRGCSMLVTFNGSAFDLPILKYHFPFSLPPVPHFDLKHGCRRIGLSGGLKSVERSVGIKRDHIVEYMAGEDAAFLWKLWEKRGNRNALELLKRYNEEDARNLMRLAEVVYGGLERRLEREATGSGRQ